MLEALPYRKDDATASYRPEYERLCGEYGYAVARVDLRGTGSSEGLATDEYPPSEQADLCQVIGWLAGQPWSTGSVGMYGTSYSGFNSLQVAAERPPALAGADRPNLVPPPGPVTLTVDRDGSALTLPVLDGPSPCPPPSLPPPRPSDPTGAPGTSPADRPEPPDRPPLWRVVRDVLGRTTEAEIDHGGRTRLPDGAVLVERYRGTVGTALDQPGLTWARGSADYRIEWPEATVATSARLDLRGDADTYEIRLDLEAREGDELRWTRSWQRRIPRRLA